MTPPRRSDVPTPGFYLIRLVKNGPWVGAAIEQSGDGWSVMVDGQWSGPAADPWSLPDMERVHHYGRFATPGEVRFRLGLAQYERLYRPDGAAANPRRAINRDKALPF